MKKLAEELELLGSMAGVESSIVFHYWKVDFGYDKSAYLLSLL
jgi:hypothetical protein